MDLLNCIKKEHIYLYLIKHLKYLFHLFSLFIIVLKPIWKWDYRLVYLIGWLVFFRLIRIRESGIKRSGCLCWIVLDGIWWIDTWLPTCFLDLRVWTTLHWFIWGSWVTWDWPEFLGFVNGQLGKIFLGLLLIELANWLIWTSNQVMTLCVCSTVVLCFAWRMFGTY